MRNLTNSTRRQTLQWTIATVLAAGLVACGGGDDLRPTLVVGTDGISTFDGGALAARLATYPLQSLSAAEADGLAYMREEEQLAHAVYALSATRWPATPIFSNIAASESTHTAAVKALLDRYQLPDPLAGLPTGTFKSASFQTLYASLTTTSAVSLIDALKVGVQIEELDIYDINARKAAVDNQDILMVYDNLLRGSRNHLRAFMRTLLQLGGSYAPQYITQAEFDAIVNSAMEPGR